ncbi:uncharacterized protein LOC121427652 [Lytechinus variegatus]|uniref:uncharacterized protein LOC121427652 n=1 Tax=Lytechinus variegatus TaxID=7654 RepID=UPI001BB27C6B|nr:uncharacterized protein LOC121427652 [Lytechinus variegatus]
MGLLVLFVFAGCVTSSSAVSCYTCKENNVTFDELEGVFELTNCSAPSPTNDFVDIYRNCTGTCVTSISLSSRNYDMGRYCFEGTPSQIASQCDQGCTSPSNCRQCCDTDWCNSDSVDTIISEHRMGQTCYECRHSEIPYTGYFNPSCGLNFNSAGEGLRYSFCQGLCYSATTFIEGVEIVLRGCRVQGEDCDYANHPYVEDPSIHLDGRYGVDYDMKCCQGSLCNTGHFVGPSGGAIVLAVSLAQILFALAL